MAKKTVPQITVVIPAFQAEKHILSVLCGIPKFVSCIVVVDDCSPDHTSELVTGCNDSRVHLVRHELNQGVGGAVLTGYQKAIELGAEIIVKMDSDDQMDPAYLIPLVAPILAGQADYTKGNRFLHADKLRTMPITRRVGNAGLSFLTKAASGYWNIFDPTNGYTAIHANIFSLLNASKIHKRYFFETSVLIELGMARAVVKDVLIPARYHNEESSLSEWKAFFEFPPRLLAGFLRRVLIQYFLRDFSIFALLLVSGLVFSLFGLVFGIYHWYLSSITNTIASTGTVMIAVLPLILGSQLLIQAMIADMQSMPKDTLHDDFFLISSVSQLLNGRKNISQFEASLHKNG